jgi:hypothetical protein
VADGESDEQNKKASVLEPNTLPLGWAVHNS